MSVRLFVLGLVAERDTYGYEIKATAHLWGLERWAQIKDGSIYHALAKLAEERLIEERNVEHTENSRPRYMYSITAQGREAFLDLLRETCRTAPTEGRAIDLGLAFIRHLPSAERVALLKERHAHLHTARSALLTGFDTLPQHGDLSPWVRVGMQHSLLRIDAEIQWNGELIDTVGDWP
jgi:DNA-binding PadR family transcriptional regulator